MRRFKFTVNDVDYTEICRAVSYTMYTKSIGRFDAALEDVEDFVGFETVKIYDDDLQVFQGRIETPVKVNQPGGAGMPLGGSEWTSKLKDYLTGYKNMDNYELDDVLIEVLKNTPFGLDDIATLTQAEVEMKNWDTTLEFLEFTFSDTCIVYDTTVEVTDEPAAGTYEYPDSNRRCCFYDKATGYFFIIGYDNDNNLLKYNSSTNLVTWKGWTTLGFNKGDNGTFGLAWDEALGILYLIVDDGTNLDSYEYTSAGGTLTQTDFDDDVAANSTLIAGPILDSEGDVWFICNDTTETDYELWQFDISANTWTEEADWATADNDDPKYMFRGSAAGDVIVIIFDDDADDLEEWLWDESGSTFAFVRAIDTTVTTVGYVCGYQDNADNMYLVWEDTDLDFSRKDISATAWETTVEVVDTSDYDTMNMFQLSGDYAQNLYLFYVKDDTDIMIRRRFEEVWGTPAVVNADADTTSRPRSPANGQALFVTWLDTGDDPNVSLMAPHGIGLSRSYGAPDADHDYESGEDFNYKNRDAGAVIQPTMNWSNSGVQSIECITPGFGGGTSYALGVYSGLNYPDFWYRGVHRVNYSGIVDNNDYHYLVFAGSYGQIEFYFGWKKNPGTGDVEWYLSLREGGALTDHYSGTTPLDATDYCVEIHWLKDGAAGICDVYVDGVSIIAVAGVDTDNGTNIIALRVGIRANNCQNETSVYFDDVAYGVERIGCSTSGWFRTDSYTASGDMNEWGSLDSTDDDDNNTVWSVYAGAGALIVGGLITAVDLEDAGVANTDDPLQIRADMGEDEVRNYVFDIRIGEKQGLIDVLVDYERCSEAVRKIADILGYEYRLDWENKLDMVSSLGQDKSDYIILKTAKSAPHPDTTPNIIIVDREPDFDSFSNAVYVKGYGDYPARVDGEAQDADSQETYGVHWLPITNKDCITVGMANTYARTEVNARKDPTIRIDIGFYDDYDAGDIEVGDMVTIIDDEIGLNQSSRIVALSYSWDMVGRHMSASLTANLKSKTFIELLAKIGDLSRWI